MKISSTKRFISALITFIFIFGLIPVQVFSQPASNYGEVLGFNRSIFDGYFSRADREIDPERWLTEATIGIKQALYAWEMTAGNFYDDPFSLELAKEAIENWSNEELEKRFTKWLTGRFFGSAAERAASDFSAMLNETQRKFTWSLDEDSNIIFDDKTGDPLIIRPGEEGRNFSGDLERWRNEADYNLIISLDSFEATINRLYPELLAFLPENLKISLSSVIQKSAVIVIDSIKKEFENIAAREERIFSTRRTMDILSLRRKSEDESARIFTDKLLSEIEEICARGIEELKVKIEQASAGTGDLALLGEEWLELYKEQFERGLKAWEEAEERFFIRRLEWEQDSINLYSEGEEQWLEAFNRFYEELNRWELNVKDLLETGELLFQNISENLEKSISDAKQEFALNMQMRLGAGTEKIKAIIDMYLTCASAAFTAKENILIIQKQYFIDIKDPSEPDFSDWFENERKKIWIETQNKIKNILFTNISGSEKNRLSEFNVKIQNIIDGKISFDEEILFAKTAEISFFDKIKYDSLLEMIKSYELYISYIEKAVDSRELILENYSELIGNGNLKDILSHDASSEDFFLDEYQIALIRAKAIVLYWERKTAIEEAVLTYANELGAGRMTDYESILAWEDAKNNYNESLLIYENELNRLTLLGEDLRQHQSILDDLSKRLSLAEEELSRINNEYSYHLAAGIYDISENTYIIFNEKYNSLQEQYINLYFSAGADSVYKILFYYGYNWEISGIREEAQYILNLLIDGDDYGTLSLENLINMVSEGIEDEINLKLRLAAINLFSDYQNKELREHNQIYSNAEWYSYVKNVNLSESDKTNIFGFGLEKQLYQDYINSAGILLEKRLEFELEIFSSFINIYKDNEPEIYSEYLDNFILTDIDDIFYVYNILQNFKYILDSEEYYFSDNYYNNRIIDYFLSGGSYLTISAQHLSGYYSDAEYCAGLLQIYDNFYLYSSFGQAEIWQDTLKLVNDLFYSYNINFSEGIFPGAEDIFHAILEIQGDPVQNTAKFLLELDQCLSYLPQWIENEIYNWRGALIEYIAAAMSYNKIIPQVSKQYILLQQDEILRFYDNLYIYIDSLEYIDDNISESLSLEIFNKRNEELILFYMFEIINSFEIIEKQAISAGENKHWRQLLANDNINISNPLLSHALSWEEGIMIDFLHKSDYYTNRLNDAFIYNTNENFSISKENPEDLFNYYLNEYLNIEYLFNTLLFQIDEISSLGLNLENSQNSRENAKIESEFLFESLKTKELLYEKLREDYLSEAELFLIIGNNYNNQYNIVKYTYEESENKRFEYEKQDAIRRWASSAYLSTDNINYDIYNEKLVNSRIALDVLSNLYDNEQKRSYNDSEYDALYSEYEQSFTRKLIIFDAFETLQQKTREEISNNQYYYDNYLFYLSNITSININYSDYISHDRSEWALKDIIIVNNNQLSFSKDDKMNLHEIDYAKADELNKFFSETIEPEKEFNNITLFEDSVRGLVQRMSIYFSDPNKMNQWGLAREYLLSALMGNNKDLKFLADYSHGLGQMEKNGQLGNLTIKTSFWPGTTKLYNEISVDKNKITKNAWDNLSIQEKEDLEFYLILTLLDNNSNFVSGFSEIFLLEIYQAAYNKTEKYYKKAKKEASKWYRPVTHLGWKEMKDINANALTRIAAVLNETNFRVQNWKNELTDSLEKIDFFLSAYLNSCETIENLERKTEERSIEWNDIYISLLKTEKVSSDNMEIIKSYWEIMQADNKKTFYNVFDALFELCNWSDYKEKESMDLLEFNWILAKQEQEKNANIYNTAAEMFINGLTDINELKIAAENAYGKTAAVTKSHLENKHNVIINNLSYLLNANYNYQGEFINLGNELLQLTAQIIGNRYEAEYAAREIEWEIMRKDISDKHLEWQKSVSSLLEAGRKDWNNGLQQMNEAYVQWRRNFESEYERVSEEWSLAYLSGLEDKEKWLQMAASSANQASAESMLLLVGAEGERLARNLDTREPFNIRDSMPDTNLLLNNLFAAAGIANINNAIGSLNNISQTASISVRRGTGGISVWDTALVKAAASGLAKETNAEIADMETRRLANNARLAASEAVKHISKNVDAANLNFRDQIDNIYIMEGHWSRSGNNYVKKVVKGSTLFEPVVSQTVRINGFKHYDPGEIKLQTNLEENYLASLDSIVIMALVSSVYKEVEEIMMEIFGFNDEDQKPGKFEVHIGKAPNQKPHDEMGKSRSSMFFDEGEGELGRLMSDFIYWQVIDSIGSAELSVAPWDKRMWNDEGSFFKSPSLRTVGTIAGSIALAGVTGGTSIFLAAAIGTASTAAFGALDLAFGFKTWDEVAFDIGKTYVTNLASARIGKFFAESTFINNSKSLINDNVKIGGSIISNTLITGAQTTTTTALVNTSLSAITYDSKNGFGWSDDIFKSGLKNLHIGTLSSMASTATAEFFNYLNGAYDIYRIFGFNEKQVIDQQTLNNLAGSLAGQAVNYYFGEDFTLNILNMSLLKIGLPSGKILNSGLLELKFNRNGTSSMSLGTGGANVSIDNLYSAFNGIKVWNVNNKISKYDKTIEQDIRVTLRAQYGYGDEEAVQQLWDILDRETILAFTEGKFNGETEIINGKRVVYLTGYHENMSMEDQLRLAVVLQHEAHRDGYKTGEIDANGNIVTKESSFNELRESSIARTEMGDRINQEHEWFYLSNPDLALESVILNIAKQSGDLSLYDNYLLTNFNNDNDYYFFESRTNGVFQNMEQNRNIPLLNSKTKEEVDKINAERRERAYDNYISSLSETDPGILFEEFINNKSLLNEYGYTEATFYSYYNFGCMVLSAQYLYEAITGRTVEQDEFHKFIKENNLFLSENILSRDLIADIINAYSNGEVFVRRLNELHIPSVERLYELDQSGNGYLIHLRVGSGAGSHSVAVSSIDFTFEEVEENGVIVQKVSGISAIHVANPWNNPNIFTGQLTYTMNEIARFDIYEGVNYSQNTNNRTIVNEMLAGRGR